MNDFNSSLGLGKTLFNSSAALINSTKSFPEIEIILTERLNRKKASGAWPELAIKNILTDANLNRLFIAENRDVVMPALVEKQYNLAFPFYDYLKKNNLDIFSFHFNNNIKYVPHHLCHAYAAMLMSPFDKAIILVIDGAGSNRNDFSDEYSEKNLLSQDLDHQDLIDKDILEECSVYLLENGKLTCVDKFWQIFHPSTTNKQHWFSSGLGTLYEKSAEYIFNDKRASGKVMGLAAYGKSQKISDRNQFLETLNWKQAFAGKTKLEWQNDNKFDLFSNVAASVQEHFEESQIARSYFLKNKYPHFENLIITGGCALNCTTNMKIYDKAIFNSIYIPPFPGDECISLGAASFLYHNIHNQTWQPCSYDHQHSYFGKKSSVPTDSEILSCFNQFNIHKPANIAAYAAEKISDGKIIAWFQGRSETGPRSLGNRSILARADKKGIKEYLNNNIKFRETFRPYGSSVLFEKSHEYFEVPQGFENPFMSFATKTLSNFKELLKDVTHVDGTSRMQTVRESQNLLFYNLIKHVGAKTGLYCVLNTSLNIMGEPVIETVEDAKRFLICSEVDGLAIGPFYITKNLL